MKAFILQSLCILIFLFSAFAQKEKQSFYERHYIGGDLSLQFGNYTTIQIAPHYGYYLTQRLSAGIGGTYHKYKTSKNTPGYQINLNIYGGKIFLRYDIIEALYIQAENELLFYKTDMYSSTREMENITSHNILGGIAYRQFLSAESKDNAYIMLLYNFNETIYTPYGNPLLRMGIEIHF